MKRRAFKRIILAVRCKHAPVVQWIRQLVSIMLPSAWVRILKQILIGVIFVVDFLFVCFVYVYRVCNYLFLFLTIPITNGVREVKVLLLKFD